MSVADKTSVNAYYSEVMFRGMDDELDVPGVATIGTEWETIGISPVECSTVRAIVLNADDITALVKLAQRAGMLTVENIAEIRKALK